MTISKCVLCGKRIAGRRTKRYCSSTCRTMAFYKRKYQKAGR